MAIGWKVVSGDGSGGWWYSAMQAETTGGRGYRLGRKTKRRKGCGPLCVFGSLGDARAFAHGQAVARCKYRQSDSQRVWFLQGDRRFSRYSFPHGTRLALWVVLLERPHYKEKGE